MLKQSDADLGIDAEYTRPGIEAFLESFEVGAEVQARPRLESTTRFQSLIVKRV